MKFKDHDGAHYEAWGDLAEQIADAPLSGGKLVSVAGKDHTREYLGGVVYTTFRVARLSYVDCTAELNVVTLNEQQGKGETA